MSILLNKKARVIVQGITGKEGRRATKAMLDYSTNVIGGVTPGKKGEAVEGKPVYNCIAELESLGEQIDVSLIYVPPFAAKQAVLEAIDNDVKLINVVTERIPLNDVAYFLAAAEEKEIRIIGPSSLGIMLPGVGRVGMIGGPLELTNEIYMPGNIGVISRSGGMTNEISWEIRKAGLGQSTVVHLGGDYLIGSTYSDILKLFEQDGQTKGIVIFGEHGGSYEFEIVDLIKEKKFTKPLAVYVGGKFANIFPEGMSIGHTGAIVEKGKGAKEKEKALKDVGVLVAEKYEDLVTLIKKAI